MKYFKLQNKIQELKTFAEVGITDVKNTGLPILDGKLGLKKGYPLFIAGNPGAGKTEFVYEILVNTAILYDWKHFIYSGEGGNIEHIYYELIFKYLQKPYKWATEQEKIKAEYFIDSHFIIANHDKDFTISEFYETVAEVETELNIKFDTTVFDPFNDVNDESDKFGGRDDKYLAYALKKVRISSKKNNRIDILVNHVADIKPISDKEGRRYLPPPLPTEWAGGRTWWRRAFTMIAIYLPPKFLNDANGRPYGENETHIIVQKAKPKGVSKISTTSIFWDWKKNRYYCIMPGGQEVYSCEQIPVYESNKMPVSNDFNVTIAEKNEVENDLPF